MLHTFSARSDHAVAHGCGEVRWSEDHCKWVSETQLQLSTPQFGNNETMLSGNTKRKAQSSAGVYIWEFTCMSVYTFESACIKEV